MSRVCAGSLAPTLFRVRLKIVWNTVRTASRGRIVAWFVLAVLLTVYGVQLTALFETLFLTAPDSFAFAAANFGMLFLFGIVQAAALAMQWFVSERDLELLGALPIPRRDLFLLRLAGVLVDLLRLGLLSVPFYLAYGLARALPWARWALLGVGWGLLWLLAAVLGTLIVFAVIRAVPGGGRTAFFRVLSLVVVVGLFAILMGYASFVRHETLWALIESIHRWQALLNWTPSTWTARLAVAAQPWADLARLTLLTGGAVLLAGVLYARGFRYEDALRERSGASRRYRHRVRPLRPIGWALFLKELRTASRDPSLVFGWVSPIVLILLVLYFTRQKPPPLAAPRLAMALVAFLVAFRVGFSLVSREGPVFPWLRSHLVHLRPLVLAKSAFVAGLIYPLAVLAGYWWRTEEPTWALWLEGLAIAWGYAFASVGIGGLFPRFHPRGVARTVRLPGVVALYTYFLLSTLSLSLAALLIPTSWGSVPVLAAMVAVGVGLAHRSGRRLARMDL